MDLWWQRWCWVFILFTSSALSGYPGVAHCWALHPGGATSTGPDATPPQLSVKTCRGGELGRGGGGSAGGGVLAAWPGEGGAARNPLLSHAYLKGVSGGMGV